MGNPATSEENLAKFAAGAELYFIGIPDDVALRWGIAPEVQYLYKNEKLPVFMVVDGPPKWDRISLQSIACTEQAPRF